jgi:hypothetical protein
MFPSRSTVPTSATTTTAEQRLPPAGVDRALDRPLVPPERHCRRPVDRSPEPVGRWGDSEIDDDPFAAVRSGGGGDRECDCAGRVGRPLDEFDARGRPELAGDGRGLGADREQDDDAPDEKPLVTPTTSTARRSHRDQRVASARR